MSIFDLNAQYNRERIIKEQDSAEAELAEAKAEIARLTSANAELRRLGDGMAERLENFKDYRAHKTEEAMEASSDFVLVRPIMLFDADDADALEAWKASKA